MSQHSRSSSEIETTTLRDVLPKFLKDFKNDFDFCDVKDMLKHIFSEEEMQLILAETVQTNQILQLFWILYDSESYIEQFLLAIKRWYPWLSKKVFDERDINPSKATEQYVYAVRALRSDFPKHVDFNVHRMQYYLPIRDALKKLKPYKHLVLSGELGVGKKWLVVDVCSEYAIMKAMGLNILWLDVHNCKSREGDFRALQQFRLLIGEGDSGPTWRPSTEFDGIDNKILHLQQYIRDRLQHEKFKDCLLILTDVQNSKTWKIFNLGCKMLIITRNRNIANSLSTSTTTHIPIDRGFTPSESFQFFEKVLHRNRNTFPKDASDIFLQCGGQPYLLSIIATNLKLNKQRNWTEWKRNLQNLQISNNNFTTIVEISLKVLHSEEMDLYRVLTIFPHSIKIPLKLLAALWNKTERDAEDVLAKFDKYSIISRKYLPDESVACILPYIYSTYLKADLNIDRKELHRMVVAYYSVDEALENRREVDLFSRGNDFYFYHCIGYHLKESGRLDLFPKLFLDFGFLGEKLRSDGFANTIGDLKYFRNEIINDDPSKEKIFPELLDFLPSVEEMLFRSKDTCLLQYALMADGLVNEEAVKQASLFYDKIWFNEKGHFHQRRQMVCLPNKPKLIELPEADTCVIALDNNDILLADISLGYNIGPVYLTDNKHAIIKMQLILQDNYIITLDAKGNLKVWSITDDRRRNASHKRVSRTKVNPLNLTQCPDMMKRKFKQIIQPDIRGPVHTFYVESFSSGVMDLHLAFDNGDICQYSWNASREKFEFKNLPILPTKLKISYLTKIFDKYNLVLSKSGDMHIYNLRDGSLTAHSFDWPKPPNILYIEKNLIGTTIDIFFVCHDKVLLLTLPKQKFEFLTGDLKTVYNINDNDSGNSFTCARLSRDGCYLVLGTKRGLIVYDTKQRSEVLRGNISECIACVDIYPLDDNVFKYIVVCGSEQSKVMNLFALRQLENNTIAWSHRLAKSTPNVESKEGNQSNSPQFEPDVWLQGNKLFDLNYSDSVLLVASDSKNRIHQLSTTDEKTWLISLPPETSRKITAITAFNHFSYCAYDNGDIFNITQQVFDQSFTPKAITFLQLINETTLVASSKDAKQTLLRVSGRGGGLDLQKIFNIEVFKCFTLADSYLILVDPIGGFIVVDLQLQKESGVLHSINNVSDLLGPRNARLGGCDFKNNYLILATVHFKIFIYKFNSIGDKFEIKGFLKYANSDKSEENDEVTCITSSFDASLFAVGLKSGTIEIYQIDQHSAKFIFRLLSHTSKIYDLKFSPNTEVLVSCSEQLCFWHVTYILNNPFDSGTKQKRRSSRFTSSHSPVEEVINALAELNHVQADRLQNPWSNKRGPMEKPELLSCIKFVGNKAEIFYANDDFTQFNTIDNEGVYYHLCVHDISRKGNVANGNGHLVNTDTFGDIDDEVIT